MKIRNDAAGWGLPARLLHWAMAAVILFLIGLGLYTVEIVEDLFVKFELIQTHKSWGFVAFSLAVIRVIWRLFNPAPPLPAGMKSWERLAAHGGHYGLYALMFIMPLTGWLMASSSELQDLYNIPNMVFGLFEMPDPFVPGDAELSKTFAAIHFWSAMALLALIAAHAGAALKHHFINKDNVLTRMIRGR